MVIKIGVGNMCTNKIEKLEESLKKLLYNSKIQHEIIDRMLTELKSDEEESKEISEEQKEDEQEKKEQPVEPGYRTSCFCLEVKENREMLDEF